MIPGSLFYFRFWIFKNMYAYQDKKQTNKKTDDEYELSFQGAPPKILVSTSANKIQYVKMNFIRTCDNKKSTG